ncbi:MAG TPA: type II toxin-antitoxin system HicB family antitoxin [Candidatus Paceibacterota bacterium]
MRTSKKNSLYFTAFFEKNELNGYTVTVPTLPGLVTEGRTIDEATKMVRDAIKCYIGGIKKAKEKIYPEKEVGSFRIAVPI